MTAIVGIAEAGRVWIASDSCLTQDGQRFESASPKVVYRNGWVWGCAGQWDAVVVLRDGLEPPPSEHADAGLFVSTAIDLLSANGLSTDSVEMLFGINGCLFYATERHDWHRIPALQSGRRRNRVSRAWHAIGSGGPYALGCLDALAGSGMTPEQLWTEALTVSSKRSTGVYPPWRHVETP